MCGWIKIHRSIKDNWLYTEKRVYSRFEAWMDILLTVNYADNKTIIKGKVYEIKRGQSILSLESWANRWGWDKSKTRRFLTLLQNDGMIVLVSDNITTQLTVCNYDSYQSERNAYETQTKRKRKTNETQTTPIKEEQEEEEIKNKRFVKPTIELIKTEFPNIDAEYFYDYYEAKGWKIGSGQMKDWKATARNWLRRNTTTEIKKTTPNFLKL